MIARPAFYLALIAVSTAGSAAAQDVENARAGAFGEVLSRDGAPWAGAEVHLLARPLPADERVGEADWIRTRTDDRGRFRASLLRGRPYTVWAVSDTDGDTYRVTRVAENYFPAVPLRLHEAAPLTNVKIRIRHRDRWPGSAPLRLKVVCDTANVFVAPLVFDPTGCAQLPPHPLARVAVEIFGADNRPLLSQQLDTSDGQTLHEIALPEPRNIVIAARAAGSLAGIGGAQVLCRMRQQLWPVGSTDADGIAQLEQAGWSNRSLLLAADGFVPAPVVPAELGETRAPLRKGLTADYLAVMGRGQTARGRWLGPDGRPMAGLPIRVEARAVHYMARNQRRAADYTRLYHTDAEGNFVIHGVDPTWAPAVTAVLTRAHVAALPPSWRTAMSPMVPYPFGFTGTGEAIEIGAHSLQPVDIRVVTPDGVPSARPRLQIHDWNSSRFRDHGLTLPADRAGHCRALLPAGQRLVLSARADGAWLLHELRVTPAETTEPPAALTVRLSPPVELHGRAVDRAGGGIAGLEIACAPALQWGLATDSIASADSGGPAVQAQPVTDRRRLSYFLRSTAQTTKTAEDGTFRFIVPSLTAVYRLSGVTNVAGKTTRFQHDIRVDAESPDPVKIIIGS